MPPRRRASGTPASATRTRQSYAGNESVVGVIGTFNSGCAAIIIPVLNQAPGGAIAMLSPANTYPCLTEAGPACADTEPDSTTRPASATTRASWPTTRTRAPPSRSSSRTSG